MQEELERQSIAVVVKASAMTGKLFFRAAKFAARKLAEKASAPRKGKQSVRSLARQNQGMSSLELDDAHIQSFKKVARRYGVDYAIRQSKSEDGKFIIFFKGRDADALAAALAEYTGKQVRKAQKTEPERQSVLAKLRQFKELVKHVDRSKQKELAR